MLKRRIFYFLFVVMLVMSQLMACKSAKSEGTGGVKIDKNAKVEIWIDAAREEVAGKFATKYPDKGKLLTLTTTNYSDLAQKILFWNNVGGGWPDASFAEPQIVPWINDAAHSYLGDLKPFVSKEVIDGFAPGALQNCWDGDKLYCLRNDLAFYVLWYNAPKVKELGISIPTTYEELKATCEKLKTDHPEVQCAIGQVGESFTSILVSNQCPFQQILGPGKLRINAVHENCVKAAKYFDEVTTKGYYKVTDMWASDTSDLIKSGNWLFMPSSSWFGDYVIRGTYFEAADPAFQGMIGVAPMPKWEGQDHAWVYWWGGAAWVLSRHSKNPQLTADFLVYMTTDVIKEQGTYPAYMPAADEWLKTRLPTLTYLEDTTKAGQILKQEASHMWTMATEAPVVIREIWGPIQTRVTSGELTYEQALQEYQKGLLDTAAKLGYQPETTGLDDFPTK